MTVPPVAPTEAADDTVTPPRQSTSRRLWPRRDSSALEFAAEVTAAEQHLATVRVQSEQTRIESEAVEAAEAMTKKPTAAAEQPKPGRRGPHLPKSRKDVTDKATDDQADDREAGPTQAVGTKS